MNERVHCVIHALRLLAWRKLACIWEHVAWRVGQARGVMNVCGFGVLY